MIKFIYFALCIGFLLFLLWNLLTIPLFRPFRSILKFFNSFFLFLRDLWNENLKTFRGYGFWLFCGLGGKGKTLSMVEYAYRMKQKYPLLRVYSTFNCSFADGRVEKWEDIVQLENFTLIPIDQKEYINLQPFYQYISIDNETGEILYFRKVHQGIIFLFDEIHFTFSSRNWKNCPNGAIEQISQNRKMKKLILGSSQSYDRVDVILREQSNFIVDCNNTFWGRFVTNKFYDRKSYETLNQRLLDSKGRKVRVRPKKKYCFVVSDYIRNLYDTNEIQRDIYNQQSPSDLIAQGVLHALDDIKQKS